MLTFDYICRTIAASVSGNLTEWLNLKNETEVRIYMMTYIATYGVSFAASGLIGYFIVAPLV